MIPELYRGQATDHDNLIGAMYLRSRDQKQVDGDADAALAWALEQDIGSLYVGLLYIYVLVSLAICFWFGFLGPCLVHLLLLFAFWVHVLNICLFVLFCVVEYIS